MTEVGVMDKLTTDLLPQVEKILPRLDSILYGIQVLVNHPALIQSLDNIESTTANLQKSTIQLNTLLGNEVPAIVSNLNKISSDFAMVSENMKEINLSSTIKSVDATLENINRISIQLNNPDSSLGLLLNDRSLYDNLDSTAKNAAGLLKDIKENPNDYVHFSVF